MVCCQEAQYELLLNKYQRFNSEPNVCQRLARMWGSGCVEQLNWKLHQKKKKLQYSLEITFHIQHDFKSLGATRKTKTKRTFLNYLSKKKKKKIILT